ncbi:hypothetical protein N184_00160 [Sinorhizobium sp. GL28]|nr:hypothetical protein N184_00160 [Sinorhizobium sp. GL28]
MKSIILAASMLTTLPSISLAEFIDGNEIYKRCEGPNAVSVATYAMGVADTYDLLVRYEKTTPFFCIPLQVSARQLKDVMCRYLREHPENRQQGAAGLGAVAFREAWPCS